MSRLDAFGAFFSDPAIDRMDVVGAKINEALKCKKFR